MRTIGCAMLVMLAACGGNGQGGRTEEPAPPPSSPASPAEGAQAGTDAATPADDCGELAGLMCRTQGLEGEACTELEQRVRDRGGDYCASRLPDAREQVGLSERLLAEDAPPGEAVAERESCPEAERVLAPTTPDPENGDFTIEEALAGLPGEGSPRARIVTRLGTLDCLLFAEEAPLTVANFVGLARGLRPWWDPCRKAWVKERYYDGLLFHRVIPRFMAQGGDVLGNGMGGPGYEFGSEIVSELRHDRGGTLAYANSGPDTNGSQFYITVAARPDLDGGYVVFGYCDGVDVIEKIVSVPRDGDDRPHSPVWLRSLTITREP